MNKLHDANSSGTISNDISENKVKEDKNLSEVAAAAANTAAQSLKCNNSSIINDPKEDEQERRKEGQSNMYHKDQYRNDDIALSSYHNNNNQSNYHNDYYHNNRDYHQSKVNVNNKGTYNHHYSANPPPLEYHNYERSNRYSQHQFSNSGAPTPPPLQGSPAYDNVLNKNPSSVFRLDSSSNASAAKNEGGDKNNNSSSNKGQYLASDASMLLSLKTPPASFDERDNGFSKKGQQQKGTHNSTLMSPKDPPQIQNVTRISPSSTFVPNLTPKGSINNNVSIEMAPSFPLFNTSFDSISDGGVVAGNNANTSGSSDSSSNNNNNNSSNNNNSNTQGDVPIQSVATAASFSITDFNASFGQSFGASVCDAEFVSESINGASSNEQQQQQNHHHSSPSSPPSDTNNELSKSTVTSTPHQQQPQQQQHDHHSNFPSGHDNYVNCNDISPTSHSNSSSHKLNSGGNVMLLGISPNDSFGYPINNSSNMLETSNHESRHNSSSSSRPNHYEPNPYDDSYHNSNYYDLPSPHHDNSPSYNNHHHSSSRGSNDRSGRYRDHPQQQDHHRHQSGNSYNKPYSSSHDHRSPSYHHRDQHPHSPPSVRNSSRSRTSSANYNRKHNYEMNNNSADPVFYETLRRFHRAFAQCTFILPGLKFTIMQYQQQVQDSMTTSTTNLITSTSSPNRNNDNNDSSKDASLSEYQPLEINNDKNKNDVILSPYSKQQQQSLQSSVITKIQYGSELTEEDITLSTRRVLAAVCAFGGTKLSSRKKNLMVSSFSSSYHNPNMDHNGQQQMRQGNNNGNSSSIFRRTSITTTTTTTTSTSSVSNVNNESRVNYEKYLSKRYYESDNHLSWENEDNPPVDDGADSTIKSNNRKGSSSTSASYRLPSTNGTSPGKVGSKSLGQNDDLVHFGSPSPIDITTSSSPGVNNENKTASQLSSTNNKNNKNNETNSKSTKGNNPQQPKMKYRCKLCGQPKQNHVCPYTQSLQRSIGAMIYPAINAFIADEPGLLAPPLSEMNNFVHLAGLENDGNGSINHSSTDIISPNRDNLISSNGIPPNNVTPENAFRHSNGSNGANINNPNNNPLSPGSSISFSPHGTPYRKSEHRHITPTSALRRGNANNSNILSSSASKSTMNGMNSQMNHDIIRRLNRDKYVLNAQRRMSLLTTHKKRKRRSTFLYSSMDEYYDDEDEEMMMQHRHQQQDNPSESLFLEETMEMKTEQFRVVTPQPPQPSRQDDHLDNYNNSTSSSDNNNDEPYTYPSLPLPYSQRKRLSDNLFALSKEVPQLTDECAVVLREARERDMWDQAVAELMVQVVTVIYCHAEDDRRMVGIRQYLLALGIAC